MINKTPLNPVIHQPIRTRILAVMVSRESITFTSLKRELDVSDGNLTVHMKKIEAAGYITVQKEFVENKPRTTYAMTELGKQAFRNYLQQLSTLLKGS